MKHKGYKFELSFNDNITEDEITKDEAFLIREYAVLKKLGGFESITAKISKDKHIDFIDFDKNIIHVCKNIL